MGHPALIHSPAIAGEKYSVTGVVLDSNGSPVPTAAVEAISVAAGGTGGELRWMPVDAAGKFSMLLDPGRYVIRAKGEINCFADPNFLFSVDPSARFPEVSVERRDVSSVEVTLGPKGGVVEGELIDRETHEYISQGKVMIVDAKDPKAFVETYSDDLGRFRMVIPHKPVVISATAPKYSTSRYQAGDELILSNCESRKIVIELNRK